MPWQLHIVDASVGAPTGNFDMTWSANYFISESYGNGSQPSFLQHIETEIAEIICMRMQESWTSR